MARQRSPARGKRRKEVGGVELGDVGSGGAVPSVIVRAYTTGRRCLAGFVATAGFRRQGGPVLKWLGAEGFVNTMQLLE